MAHRILVVDDEETVRSTVQEYLEQQGYQVVAAGDGEEGIKAFTDTRPHLAVIDFLLPRKNGFAVAEAIRKESPRYQVPLIMMSGVFKNPKTAVEAREKYQVVEFLSKPLDLPGLGQLIRSVLEGVPDDPAPESAASSTPGAVPRSGAASSVSASISSASASEIEARASQTGRASASAPRGLSMGPSSRPQNSIITPPPVDRSGTDEASMIQGGVYRGRPFKEFSPEGEIAETPVALLLASIRFSKGTGMLDLTDRGTHRRIYITKGNPTFMQSNAEGENVGALLLRRGRITEPDFDRCLRYMKDRGRTLQQSLLEMRLVSESDLATAYKLLAGQLLPMALGMAAGTYNWRLTDAFIGRVPEGKFEPIQVLFKGIKQHVHPPQIIKFFAGKEDIPMYPTSQFEVLLPTFRRVFSNNNIAGQMDGSKTYRLLSRSREVDPSQSIPQLFALVCSGMVALPQDSASSAFEAAVHAAAAEVANVGRSSVDTGDLDLGLEEDDSDFNKDERKARMDIDNYYDVIMSQDFFEIFGASPQSETEEIKAAYFELAKKWHADAYSGLRLGQAQQKVDDIFARITEAYETITHKSRREEYLVYLDRKAKGLPTDVNEILRGEQLFDQATAMIRRRDWSNAVQVLEEAVRLNPDPIYYATLGWTIFNRGPSNRQSIADAVKQLKYSLQEQENLPVAYQYLGQISFHCEEYREAKKWWKKCIEWEPNNIEAARGIRMINSRNLDVRASTSSAGPKSGLLNRLRKK